MKDKTEPYYKDKDRITIYNGDCLEIMKWFEDRTFDLVLTDPPYGIKMDRRFGIKWKNNNEYLNFIETICKNIYRILKCEGSFYLMIDRVNSHKVKLLLDKIFEEENFRSEIIWDSSIPYSAGYKWLSNNYIYSQIRIFYYVKSSEFIFNKQMVDVKQPSGDISKKPLKDIWADIKNFAGFLGTKEKSTGIPTQKPIKLMERIIKASSKEGNIILDPFMGSGTTLVAAKKLGRKAVGIEINEEYCKIAKERIRQAEEQLI